MTTMTMMAKTTLRIEIDKSMTDEDFTHQLRLLMMFLKLLTPHGFCTEEIRVIEK